MAVVDVIATPERTMPPALRLELAAVLRKSAGHYTAAAAEAAGRGNHTLAGVYKTRASQNRAEADAVSTVEREHYTARFYGLWAAATNFRRYAKAAA